MKERSNLHAKIKKWLIEYKYILIICSLFFLGHLFFVTSPILDTHAWRQADTTAVARNFAEESPNILLPRVDIRGEFSGITGMEFPIYNYTIFLFNKIFASADWYGRLISSFMGMIGIYFFYLLITKRYGKKIALYSSFAFATSPLFFYFSRNIQPDVSMVSLSIISLYLMDKYCESRKYKDFIIAIVILSIAMLIKLPAIFMTLPMIYMLFKNKLFGWREVAIAFLIAIVPSAAWYEYSQYLSNFYGLGNYYYDNFSITRTLQTLTDFAFWEHVFILRIPSTVSTVLGATAALLGLIISIKKRDYFLFTWLLSVILFIFMFSTKTYYHTYYSLPLVPVIAVLAGVGFDYILKKFGKYNKVAICVVIIIVLVNLMIKIKPLYVLNDTQYLSLEKVTVNIVNVNDRVIVNGGPAPVMLYFSHRKGWTTEGSAINTALIEEKKALGAKYLIADKKSHPIDFTLINPDLLKKVYEDNNFTIYGL